MPTLHLLIGPTAVGKTALGIAWARANNAEILCADAPLIYKGMDIGTAKPTAAEQLAARHHGLDWAHVTGRFNVGDYITQAQQVVEDVFARGKNLIIVGGSGFYLKSFFEPVVDGLPVSPEVQARVAALEAQAGLPGLLEALLAANHGEPVGGLDTQNPRRVAKALERCWTTGRSTRALREHFESLPKPYAAFTKKVTCLMRERECLKARIHLRAGLMLQAGLIEEVQQLLAQGLSSNPQAATVIGYREVIDALANPTLLPTLQETITQNTLGLVRKQLTFFKQLPITQAILLGDNESGSPELLF